MHDEFCPSTDDADACSICMIIKMARRDEQDKFSGDEEMDRELVEQEAFQKGFEAGTRQKTATATTVVSDPAEAVSRYIKDKMTTLTMQEINTLYTLYQELGGK
jgi:hypothetical protein